MSRLPRQIALALLVVSAAGPALAQQAAPQAVKSPPCVNRLILAAPGYSPAQKALVQERFTQAVNAGVDQDALEQLTAMSVARGVGAEPLVKFYELLRRVAADGLPVAAFETKMAEGLSKGATPELILQVVLARERNFLRARQLMIANLHRHSICDQSFYRVLDLSAEGLRRGVPPDNLAQIYRSDCALEEIGRGVSNYLYMQAIGFPLDAGLDITLAALKAGHFRDCRSCLGQIVFTARRAGTPSRRIRDELVRGMRSGRDLTEISKVLYAAPK
jgi:hypothetical protein